jgi:lipopolysaccharide transport system permease protein
LGGLTIRSLWFYKYFIIGLAIRDFKSKYLNSVLGGVWAVINPIALIVVYTVIFSEVMQAKLPGVDQTWAYSIYLCSGLLPWLYFVETMQRLQNVFIEQSILLKKVSFPRISLPVYVLISTTINFAIVLVIFMFFLIVNGHFPGITIIGILPLLIVQQILALGLGVLVGTLNVFFRDVGHVFGIVIQFWFWFTPIVYTVEILPEKFIGITKFNIITPILTGYQQIFLHHKFPAWDSLVPVLIFSLVTLFLAYFVYKKLVNEMVDEL